MHWHLGSSGTFVASIASCGFANRVDKSVVAMAAVNDYTTEEIPEESDGLSQRAKSEGPPGLEGSDGRKVSNAQGNEHGSGAGGSAAVGGQSGGWTQEAMTEMV